MKAVEGILKEQLAGHPMAREDCVEVLTSARKLGPIVLGGTEAIGSGSRSVSGALSSAAVLLPLRGQY